MSLASSSLGKAILVLIVIVVSILIFSSKVKDASLPFLNWGEEESSSGSSYVVSSIQLAVKNLNTFHNFVFSDSPDSLSFNLGEDNFYVYYGIYKGENYYLMFKDEDPWLKLGSSYELGLDEEDNNLKIEVEKRSWLGSTIQSFDVAYFDKMDFLIYDATELYKTQKPELLSCPEGKFCVTARLVNKKKYYFSHYIYNAKSHCADYYPEVAFVASEKEVFGDSSKLCIDETNYAYSLFDDLFKNIPAKTTLDLSGLKNLNENFLIMFGLYNDGTGLKNLMILYDVEVTDALLSTLLSSSYDTIFFDRARSGVIILNWNINELFFIHLDSKQINDPLFVPIENINKDYINNLKDYVSPGDDEAVFVPILYLYKDGYALIRRPYEGHFEFEHIVFQSSDTPYVKINCKKIDSKEYCYLEPVRR